MHSGNNFLRDLSSLIKRKKRIELSLKGYSLVLESSPKEKAITISTIIFSEEDYIPIQIKKWIDVTRKKEKKSLAPYLEIDKDDVSVSLFQKLPLIASQQLSSAVDRFILQAQKWASILKDLY